MEAKSAGIDWRLRAAGERAILMLGFGFLRLEGYEKTLENMLISRSFCPDAVRELELFSFSISSDRHALIYKSLIKSSSSVEDTIKVLARSLSTVDDSFKPLRLLGSRKTIQKFISAMFPSTYLIGGIKLTTAAAIRR